ncbi:MAG: heavy-metal-associated domain-containing protein [Rhodothermales bacterium]
MSSGADAAKGADHNFATPSEADVVLHVKGLACESCAKTMKERLIEIDGIDNAQVFLEGEQYVDLFLQDGATVTEDRLTEAVEGCGFVLERVEFRRKGSTE